MPVQTPCPKPPQLQQLLNGQASEAEFQRLEQHILTCDRCGQLLCELKPDDTRFEGLRQLAVDPQRRPAVERLVARLEQLAAGIRLGTTPAPERTDAAEPRARKDSGAPPRDPAKGPAKPLSFDFLAPPEQPDEIGRLAHYRVRKLLGQGGMGMVFQAIDTHLDRPVALKVMKPELSQNEEQRRRFLREAKATAALKHDNIVTIYQVGEDRGVVFLAVEFLVGEALDRWLERGKKPSISQVLRLGREIARGLAAAHERGLIHRDIKPANIWLEAPGGRVKILDFGLARSNEDTHLTQSGVIVGTPAFMAPEQAQGA